VICPKCGEDNADNFRFCGMCGAVLASPVPAGAPRVLTVREGGIPALSIPANPPKARAEKPVEPISGPSVLGLGQPTLDSLRDKAFSGSDPFFEPEEPKTGGRKLLLLLLLVALGAAAWWTYTNYVAIGESPKQETAASKPSTNQPPAEKPATPQPATETKSADAAPVNPAPSAGTPSQAAENPPAKANLNPESKPDTAATAAAERRAPEQAVKAAAAAKAARRAAVRDSRKTALAPKAAVPPAADTGDADFRKGEAFLYGRGVRENCDGAIKNLKAASAKRNARARSTFGTMYATGHCVPRDLPTSYSWFALALRVDPNNQILEKDLSAIWNQMTPPERQLATKLKQ
jgi:pyruvate/2-oxoglutarate dehydrogenase complex dihydrolipoamide acyltransferase (E2) component